MNSTKAFRLLPTIVCLLSALCGPLWSAPVEEVFSFLESPTQIPSLVQAPDGFLYGIANGGKRGPADAFGDTRSYGFVFRMTLGGRATVLHRFDGTHGAEPVRLILGQDGVMYGVTAGGNGLAAPTLFKLATDGTVTTLHTFSADESDGLARAREIVADAAGTIYGWLADGMFKRTSDGSFSTFASGASQLCLNSAGVLFGVQAGPRIVRFSSSGVASTLHTFGDSRTVILSLRAGTDGQIYGGSRIQVSGQPSTFFRLTEGGMYTVLFAQDHASGTHSEPLFLRQDADGIYFINYSSVVRDSGLYRVESGDSVRMLVGGQALAGQIPLAGRLQVAASDGYFYGVIPAVSYPHEAWSGDFFNLHSPVVTRLATDGTVTAVAHDFTGEGSFPSGGLSRGLDGKLYGVTFKGGSASRGTIFRFDPANATVGLVHELQSGEGCGPVGRLAVDADGNLHGITEEVGTIASVLFRCTTTGDWTVRYQFPASSDGGSSYFDNTTGRLAVGSDRALYGWHRSLGLRKLRIFRYDANGVFKTLLTTALETYFSPLVEFGEPVAGSDAAFYFGGRRGSKTSLLRIGVPDGRITANASGFAYANFGRLAFDDGQFFGIGVADSSGQPTLFRTARDVPFTTVRNLPANLSFSGDLAALTEAADGRIYGLLPYSVGGTRVFATSAAGGFRLLGKLEPEVSVQGGPVYVDANRGAALIQGSDGNLYGTTPRGGQWGGGMIFKVTPLAGNAAPLAADDALQIRGKTGWRLDVLANDSDADGDAPFIASIAQGAHGTATIERGGAALFYTPGKTFTGTDTFTYTIRDGFGGSATANVTVTNPFFTSGGVYNGVLVASAGTPWAIFSGKLDPVSGTILATYTHVSGGVLQRAQREIFELAPGSLEYKDPAADSGLHTEGRTIRLTAPGMLEIIAPDGATIYTATLARKATTLPAGVLAGRYALRLPAPAGADTLPGGSGYAVGTVSAKGLVKLAGALPDGAKFSLGGTLTTDGKLSFHLPLYTKPKGYLAGTLDFTAAATTRQLGPLRWVKPAQAKPAKQLYSGGFDTTLAIAGATYTPPPLGTGALHGGTTATNYDFAGGYRGQPVLLEKVVTVDAADRVVVTAPGPDAFRLTINRSTSLVSGDFKSPSETGALRKFIGVLFQPDTTADGLFIGPTATGTISLRPPAP